MTIITELGNMFAGMPGPNPTVRNQDNSGDSFQNIISDMTKDSPEYENVETEVTGATETKQTSYEESDDSMTVTETETTNVQETSETNPQSKEENSLSMDDYSEMEQEVLSKTAKLLGVEKEALLEALENLGIRWMDLLNPQNVNALVAEVKAGGDMTALVTNGELSELVKQLNLQIETIFNENAAQQNMDVETLKGLLESMDAKVEGNASVFETANGEEMVDVAPQDTLSEAKGNEQPKTSESALEDGANTETAKISDTTQNVNEGNTANQNTFGEHESGRSTGRESLQQGTTEVINQTMMTNDSQVVTEIPMPEEMPEMGQTDPAEIIQQIKDQMQLRMKADITELSMQLNPENLGTVQLTVASKEGNVTAQLFAQNDAVRAALESQILVVKEHLEQQGVRVDAIEVSVASHEFERNLQQGNDENKQQEDVLEDLKKATRKIDLNGIADLDALEEELEESEMVTAKMMQADGNSMDYKV